MKEERREGGNGGGQCLCKLIRQRRRLHVSTGRGHIKCVWGGGLVFINGTKTKKNTKTRQQAEVQPTVLIQSKSLFFCVSYINYILTINLKWPLY